MTIFNFDVTLPCEAISFHRTSSGPNQYTFGGRSQLSLADIATTEYLVENEVIFGLPLILTANKLVYIGAYAYYS